MWSRHSSDLDAYAASNGEPLTETDADRERLLSEWMPAGTRLYRQTWRSPGGCVVSFDVLCYPDYQDEHGRIRLAGMPGSDEDRVIDMVLLSSVAAVSPALGRVESVLLVEDYAELAIRARETRRRESGPQVPSYTPGSAEQTARAYNALAARLRRH